MNLSSAELAFLKEYVRSVLLVCANDDTGVTDELIDITYSSGEILGILKEDMDEVFYRG